MKKNFFLISIAMLISKAMAGQHHAIAAIYDSSANKPIPGATATLLSTQDSMLLQYGYADNNGIVKFRDLPGNKYILLISNSGYIDYADFVTVKPGAQTDWGRIILTPRDKLLEEVVIRQKIAAIRIRGDTTEYVADSFRLHKNATVEELLNNLPGIQVDKKGNITAQGKAIKKVLVDGEEFFGDDPTLVTRNFRAAMVDKVQVYDKRSDNLTDVTGVEKQKVIDLKLKEDGKNGYFGKIVAGGGYNKVYENQAMFNYFKNKRKIAIYGTLGNTGLIGLSSKDNEKYNTGIDPSITGDVDLDSWGGNYTGQGIPKAIAAGFHFSNRWNNDKQHINLNYKLSDVTVSGNNNSLSQNILENDMLLSKSIQTFHNSILRNIATVKYDHNIDKTLSIKAEVSGALNHKESESSFTTENRSEKSGLLNSGSRTVVNEGDFNSLNIYTRMEKALAKKGRVVALDLRNNYLLQNSMGNLYSNYTFYDRSGNTDSVVTTDQLKKNQSVSNYLDVKATYIEPLSASTFLSFRYNLLHSKSNANIKTYNLFNGKSNNLPDSLFSNNFDYSRTTHQGGLTLLYTKNKLRLNIGTDVATIKFHQANLFTNNTLNRSFFNFYPLAEIIYTFKLQKSMSFRYAGNVVQPLINQLQPVANNTDPINIYTGNAALAPYYSNTIYVTYNSYRPSNKQYFFSNATYSFSKNSIGLDATTDVSSGKTTYLYVNLSNSNVYTYNSYIGIGKIFQRLGNIYGGVNFNANGGKNVIRSNNFRNNLISGTYELSAYINKAKSDVFFISLNGGASYNINVMSLQTGVGANYWAYKISPALNFYFPHIVELFSDFDYIKRQKTLIFKDHPDMFLLNFSAGKRIGKHENWFLKCSGKDLLNQNKGFSRKIANSLITENNYSTIGRYFLLSLSWDFNSNNVKK